MGPKEWKYNVLEVMHNDQIQTCVSMCVQELEWKWGKLNGFWVGTACENTHSA
jgi:hypothetical protein